MDTRGASPRRMLEALDYLARALGRGMGLPVGPGTSSLEATSSSSQRRIRLTTLTVHVLLSAAFGLLYTAGIERSLQPAGWVRQALQPVVHQVIGVSIRTLMPALNLLVPEMAPEPGLLLAIPGAIGIVAFMGLHLCCSLILGEVYGLQGRGGVERGARAPGGAPSVPVRGPHRPTG